MESEKEEKEKDKIKRIGEREKGRVRGRQDRNEREIQ